MQSFNKTAIITGAAKGIGRAAALKFASEHFNITLVDISQQELQQVYEEIKNLYEADLLMCCGDLADWNFLQHITTKTIEKWERIDVLVNNAAWRTLETMRTISIESWERTMRICLTAPAFLAKQSAEVMERLVTGGTILNISSVMSERAGGSGPAYISAKGAIESLTYELAVTYGRSSIRAVCVQPGFIETNLSHDYKDPQGNNISDIMIEHVKESTPLGRGGQPEEISEALYWLTTDAASFITGTTLLIDGGLKHNFNSYPMKKLQFPDQF
ncbi:MAG: SDR family oxidoreductase [Chitinophagaceae bacterium]